MSRFGQVNTAPEADRVAAISLSPSGRFGRAMMQLRNQRESNSNSSMRLAIGVFRKRTKSSLQKLVEIIVR